MPESNQTYAMALHGGAGAVAGRDYAVTEKHLRQLATDCDALLAAGRSALDVVEHAVCELETCGLYVAGRGSAPNTAGHVELDASIMDGRSREAGQPGARRARRDGEDAARHARGTRRARVRTRAWLRGSA